MKSISSVKNISTTQNQVKNRCDKWIHKVGEEIWFCSNCLNFPFRYIINEGMISLFEENNRVMSHTNFENFNPFCSICQLKLAKLLKGIPCCCCSCFIHRKCSKLKLSEIRNFYKNKLNTTWDCYSCKKENIHLLIWITQQYKKTHLIQTIIVVVYIPTV